MQKRSDEIRDKYIANPPEGMTADDIRHMSEDDLLDMDYFLKMKTMSLVKTFLVRKVSIFSKNLSSTRHARLRAGRFYAKWTPKENFPIKIRVSKDTLINI